MTEFLAKWAAAALLLRFAWDVRRRRRRAVGLVLAAFALLAYEVGLEESLLEAVCAVLAVREGARVRRVSGRAAALVVAIVVALALIYFAAAPWVRLLSAPAGVASLDGCRARSGLPTAGGSVPPSARWIRGPAATAATATAIPPSASTA